MSASPTVAMHQLQANEILLTQQNKLSQNTYISISISFFSIAQTHTVRPKAQGALYTTLFHHKVIISCVTLRLWAVCTVKKKRFQSSAKGRCRLSSFKFSRPLVHARSGCSWVLHYMVIHTTRRVSCLLTVDTQTDKQTNILKTIPAFVSRNNSRRKIKTNSE